MTMMIHSQRKGGKQSLFSFLSCIRIIDLLAEVKSNYYILICNKQTRKKANNGWKSGKLMQSLWRNKKLWKTLPLARYQIHRSFISSGAHTRFRDRCRSQKLQKCAWMSSALNFKEVLQQKFIHWNKVALN